MKTCTRCKELKQFDQFGPDTRVKDGRRSACRACVAAYNRKKYAASKEYRERSKAKATNWAKENPERTKEIRNEHGRKNYEKRKEHYSIVFEATKRLNNAVRDGKIIKPEVCCIDSQQCRGRLEAHHDDYSKPLDVIWFCTAHHKQWHKLFVPEGNKQGPGDE